MGEPFNHTPFPGDTDPEDAFEHFVAEGLKNGVKYNVAVRVVYPDGSLSRASNRVAAVCGPRGDITLAMRYKGNNDGFSFEQNTYIAADDLNNDLYFFSKDGIDYLASPSRLNGFLKANRFKVLPLKGELEDIKGRVPGYKDAPDEDRVAIEKDDWVLIRLPDETYTLVRVRDVYGQGEERSIRLFYAYDPLPGAAGF
jgi:hypothetical protein